MPSPPPGSGAPSGPLFPRQDQTLPVGPGYLLQQRIGVGGFGEVWRAEAPGGMPVAVKIINRPIDHEQARRELQALEIIKSLRHAFLLTTHAFWVTEDRLVVVMDLADGTLRDRLKHCQAYGLPGVPARELLGYFRDAAEAIDYMHSKGVLHRDVKPDNLLLRDRHVAVADFGLVRQNAGADVTVSSSGTPNYMALEAWRGKPGPASDQYSLACSWMELRLGRRPFGGAQGEALMQQLEGKPDLSGLHPLEEEVIRRALNGDPAQRYPSCLEMVAALEQALAGVADPPPPPTMPRQILPTNHQPSPALALPGTLSKNEMGERGLVRIGAEGPGAPDGPQLSGLDSGESMGSFRADTDRQSDDQSGGGGWRPTPQPNKSRPIVVLLLICLATACLTAGVVAVIFLRPDPPDTGQTTSSKPDTTLPETTKSKPPEVLVPDQFEQVGDESVTVGNDRFAKRIARRVGPKKEVVEFVLVPDEPKENTKAYYLMEHKVSNGLYGLFAEKDPAQAGNGWKQGGLVRGMPLGADNPKLPVLRVKRAEAEGAANWLGGRLPTASELVVASGLWNHPDGQPGPAKGPNVAVNQIAGPRPVDWADSDDVSPLGVRDLSGNGEEWTSTDFTVGNIKFAVVSGRSYRSESPLQYIDLEIRKKMPMRQDPNIPTPWTGFRVAVDLPSR